MNANQKAILAAVVAALMVAIPVFADSAYAAETADDGVEYDQDLGSFWSLTIGFSFSGSDAKTVSWDFGDGSENVTGFSAIHTYKEKGVYYVTQTCTNTAGTSTMVSKVTVLGYPYVEFDTQGGSEVQTITMTSGGINAAAAVEPEEIPVKAGYTFTGWYTEPECENQYDWDTLVKEPVKLYAGWESNAQATISFDVDEGYPPVEDVQWTIGTQYEIPSYEGTKEGYTFAGWSCNGQTYLPGQTITIEGDTILTAVWTVNEYTVAFETGGGSKVDPQQVAFGGHAVEPAEAPTKTGHTFAGWFLGDSEFDFENTPIEGNVTLTAHWAPIVYTVQFDSDGGSKVDSQQVAYGDTADEPADPTKSSYRFEGWLLNGVLFDFDTPITDDITLKADWSYVAPPVIRHTVTFDPANGGSETTSSVVDGNRVSKPQDPVWEGHTFAGWFLGDVQYDFGTPVTRDIELTARWTVNEYTVSFATAHGTAPADQTVAYGELAKEPAAPAWDGGRFLGWFTADDVQFDFGTPVQGDIELTAKWAPYVAKVSVDTDGDGKADRTIGLIEGESYQLPAPNRPGHSFEGWDTDGDGKADMQAGQELSPAEDVTIKALWKDESKLTVVFDIDGQRTERTVSYGARVAQPADPSKDGYQFDGWFVNGEEYDFSSRVTSDITIVAKWTKVHTITVVPDDGYVTPVDPVVPDGGEVVLPDATKPGYELGGWDTDGDGEADASAGDVIHVEDDTTLEPVWEEVPEGTVQFTITIEGADIGITGWVLKEGDSIELPPAEREGYAFGGWMIDGTLYGAWEEFTPTKDVTAIAQWSELPKHDVEVSVDEDASVSSEVPSEVPEGSAVTLPDASRPGSVLEGWDTDGDGVADAMPGDDITVDDDTVVKPVWRPVGDDEDQYEVSFDGSASIDTWYPVDGGSVVLPEPEDPEGFEGWYDGDEYIGMPGDTWYPSADASLTAKHTAEEDDNGALAYVWILCLVLCVGFVLFLAWDKTVWLAIPVAVLAALTAVSFYLWGGFL